MDHHTSGTNWGSAVQSTTFTAVTTIKNDSLRGGADGSAATVGQMKTAYEKFEDAETTDINLIIAGTSSATHVDNLITIAENRKDAVVFASPERSDVVNVANSVTQTTNVTGFFNSIRSSSFVVFDSGYKYTYDKYNDVFRFVPLNGDLAGLCARTDLVADSHFSPAGFNRGVIRGAVKLAFNPNKPQRDELYTNRINPIVSLPGTGPVLFGDKTGLASPSAFDRINVRRLFLTIEQALEGAANAQLFELKDDLTRANFRAIVEPYLRDVQAKRGLNGFLVICDETNNTPDVIDNNEFRADIFLKPAKSINYVTPTFVATRTGISFEEVAGRV
jgi:phage tail sheath protein FI